jgi:hypothetical protein
MGEAYEEPEFERFHEWRKRIKYHRYHTRIDGHRRPLPIFIYLPVGRVAEQVSEHPDQYTQ